MRAVSRARFAALRSALPTDFENSSDLLSRLLGLMVRAPTMWVQDSRVGPRDLKLRSAKRSARSALLAKVRQSNAHLERAVTLLGMLIVVFNAAILANDPHLDRASR